MIENKTYHVPPKSGLAKRLPERAYTTALENCLGVVLYSAETGVVGLAHVYDTVGPARYSADNVVESLLEDMLAVDANVNIRTLRAHLIGEQELSLAFSGNRTLRVTAALRKREIRIVTQIVGGHLWKNIYVHDGPARMLFQGYLEDSVQRYGEFHAEQEEWLKL